MTTLLLSLALSLLSANLVLSQFPDEWVTDCKKENGVTEDMENLDYDDPSFPQPVKCYMACYMGKQKVMKPDGTINKDRAKELYEMVYKNDEKRKQMFLTILNECYASYKVYPNKCDTAFSYVKCKKQTYDKLNP